MYKGIFTMNYTKKNIYSFLCVSSLLFQTSQSRANGWEDIGKGLAIAGAAAFVTGTAMWALSEEDNKSMLNRAQNAYNTKELFSRLIPLCRFSKLELDNLSESDLETFALFLSEESSIESNLCRSLYALESVHNDLYARIKAINNGNHNDTTCLWGMTSIEKNISDKIYYLKEAKRKIDLHKRYCALFAYERTMHDRYSTEFQIIATQNNYACQRELISCSLHHRYTKYPYSNYLEMIQSDQRRMSELCNAMPNYYPQRKKSALWVIQTLAYLERTISASYEYKEELLRKKHDAIEQERQRIAEQQRRHEANLKAERKRLKKERKKLEKMTQECTHTSHDDCVHKTSINIRWQS